MNDVQFMKYNDWIHWIENVGLKKSLFLTIKEKFGNTVKSHQTGFWFIEWFAWIDHIQILKGRSSKKDTNKTMGAETTKVFIIHFGGKEGVILGRQNY